MTEINCDAQKCDVMDRRGFLAKSAVGGAIVVGGGLATRVGSAFGASKSPGKEQT